MNNFETTFEQFKNDVIRLLNSHQNKTNNFKCIEFIEGRKYIRVAEGGRVKCFVEKETGDIFKAASWTIPAPKARGNIYKENYGLNKFEQLIYGL